ncbi:MAG: TRM11 family SAM-dependent methyltransferase [Candidatus Dojkabacteria bacterium]|jgi:tRNA G10  N-methylase Trm11
MHKQYFFEAGVFPELSLTELFAVLESFNIRKDIVQKFSDTIFLVKDEKITDILFENLFKRLGGFVRAGYIVDDLDSFLSEYQQGGKKVVFGITILGENRRDDLKFLKKLGHEIKSGLKESGVSSRFVLPIRKSVSLNAAQVIKNDILEKGFELNIIRNGNEEIYGKTLYVQDLEGFVNRDIDRPNSDTKMGVLPPKLARMMVNFTGLRDGIVWDPFCGSGTIPMEAAMIGFNVLGSDIDSLAVASTDENIRWLNRDGEIKDILYETFIFDVTKPDAEIVKKLRNTNISAIVCEPFMGPPQRSVMSTVRADELLEEVKKLYRSLFDLIDNRLEKRGIRVVIVVPSYKTYDGWRTFGISELVSNRWILKNTYYSPNKQLKWFRKDSIITRNIFILERS